jgi:hypothetical protein
MDLHHTDKSPSWAHNETATRYASQKDAEIAISRLLTQPGFEDWPDGFCIDEYTIGEDHWTEGFIILVNIFIPSIKKEIEYFVADTIWRPGDIYEICSIDDTIDPSSLAFKVGNLVICEERTIDGNENCLVAVELFKKKLHKNTDGPNT